MNTQNNFAPHDILENQPIPTLREAYESYISDRRDLRDGSIIVYNQAIKRAGNLLDIPINQLRFSDFKHQYAHLRYDIGYKPASIELLNSLLVPTLNLAVKDDILIKNPAAGAYREIARGDAWKSNHKNALSAKTQAEFLQHVHNSRFRNWENFFILLFGTGLRIGEAVGLKWQDINFETKTIKIQRSISFRKRGYVEGPPKSNAGFRTIPMLPSVMEALLRELQLSKLTKFSVNQECIPGEKGYIFLNSKGKIHCPATVNQAIKNIVNDYNKIHPECAMDSFSAHQIRHSFCTRLCERDVNIKVIQAVMGHSDFGTTMNIYAEVGTEKITSEFATLQEIIYLA